MPLQPFKATVPQDGKSWWLRLGKEKYNANRYKPRI